MSDAEEEEEEVACPVSGYYPGWLVRRESSDDDGLPLLLQRLLSIDDVIISGGWVLSLYQPAVSTLMADIHVSVMCPRGPLAQMETMRCVFWLLFRKHRDRARRVVAWQLHPDIVTFSVAGFPCNIRVTRESLADPAVLLGRSDVDACRAFLRRFPCGHVHLVRSSDARSAWQEKIIRCVIPYGSSTRLHLWQLSRMPEVLCGSHFTLAPELPVRVWKLPSEPPLPTQPLTFPAPYWGNSPLDLDLSRSGPDQLVRCEMRSRWYLHDETDPRERITAIVTALTGAMQVHFSYSALWRNFHPEIRSDDLPLDPCMRLPEDELRWELEQTRQKMAAVHTRMVRAFVRHYASPSQVTRARLSCYTRAFARLEVHQQQLQCAFPAPASSVSQQSSDDMDAMWLVQQVAEDTEEARLHLQQLEARMTETNIPNRAEHAVELQQQRRLYARLLRDVEEIRVRVVLPQISPRVEPVAVPLFPPDDLLYDLPLLSVILPPPPLADLLERILRVQPFFVCIAGFFVLASYLPDLAYSVLAPVDVFITGESLATVLSSTEAVCHLILDMPGAIGGLLPTVVPADHPPRQFSFVFSVPGFPRNIRVIMMLTVPHPYALVRLFDVDARCAFIAFDRRTQRELHTVLLEDAFTAWKNRMVYRCTKQPPFEPDTDLRPDMQLSMMAARGFAIHPSLKPYVAARTTHVQAALRLSFYVRTAAADEQLDHESYMELVFGAVMFSTLSDDAPYYGLGGVIATLRAAAQLPDS